MKRALVVVAIGLGLWAIHSSAEEVTFKKKGQVIATLSVKQILEKVKPETLAVHELHDFTHPTYRGVPLAGLLKAVYGDSVEGLDEVLFTCADGYQPSVPIDRVQKHKSLLAFEKTKGDFKFTDKNLNKEIEYGPAYVVWDNLRDPELTAEGNENWPYQVVTIDLIDFSDRFPNIAPPKKSPNEVTAGFLAYRSQCFQCHTINGEGGAKSTIELNYPVNVTEYFDEKYLLKWISDPTKIRYNATMPQVNPEYPHRDRLIHNIVAYLKAMAKVKRAPKAATK